MKLKFKVQPYQTHAVDAFADCFAGQPKSSGVSYRVDPGAKPFAPAAPQQIDLLGAKTIEPTEAGFKNAELALNVAQLLGNIQGVQRRQNLPLSASLASDKHTGCTINLDVEMETGTGKTYCYIKSMFELNKRFGWSKFIVVVPSIAIREGVYKSLQITAEHFLESYGKKARFFIYNSKQLHNLESFSSDAGINVMVINVQAFAARGADQRRIYEELDDFQSRRPIDVIKANRPILLLDEPQKMEGAKTLASFSEFNPLMIVRYSATHKTEYNKIHRLDALDAYNQKLVKKISVRGITVKGLTGTNAYLFLQDIEVSTKSPVARVEIEIKQSSGIKRVMRKLGRNDNLYDLSGGLDQYKDYVVADIDARIDTLSFTNGVELVAGEVVGNVDEAAMRRIQIREAVKAHFQKEMMLFSKGIKVLSLFFIDEVAKYRQYDATGELPGEYAQIFEEEYNAYLTDVMTLEDTPYNRYLKGIQARQTHNGYFSIDKKSKRLVDPSVGKKATETDDVDAYDLILKDKERLLSLDEPVRFIFSHSALREGWDNPNVFVICTLKHSDNSISRRQEVGRGMRLAVNQLGDRMDDPATVHQINELTVVASESYKDFVGALQRDISESLSARPREANENYFKGKVLQTLTGDVEVSAQLAKQIYKYLLKNDYTDDNDQITLTYHEAKKQEQLAELPAELQPYAAQVFQLIDSVFSAAQMPEIGDDRKAKINPLNSNFEKKEFQALWNKINRKAAYTVHFETDELVGKCVAALDTELRVKPMQYIIERGSQLENASFDDMKSGTAFKIAESSTEKYNHSVHSAVKYDLIGNLAEDTQLTRSTIASILKDINVAVFSQYKTNPEDFIAKAAMLINEQKATAIVEHIAYDPVGETHSSDIFTAEKPKDDFSKAFEAKHHVYDYVFTDSSIERKFVEELDASTEVVVYAKLPKSFFIPTPVGNYNPDWAIAFQEGNVKHIYFIAETKGSMSTLDLRAIEASKIACARKFFAKITSEQVRYDVVDGYGKLMELVK
ncbi:MULTISPECIES: type III restriction-modification system endonuclease [Pseudomonas]|uniref:type III restriction-modification system endonuclease n=1 Tax=Pseudomonas TaxID=286 RepID=UPI0004D1B379|nr:MULTISPECIES: DEAD/DEAH box helicase family protein [Pseudomonas]AIG03227.1 restriction endonuclease subunit R [Pseudomonas fluorescens]MBF4558941.1 DEAD/DEAH box helicase family protein [Pseudomonas sp. p50(2008)]